MAYLNEPDHSGHYFGPHSRQTRQAVMRVDSLLASLSARIGQLEVSDSVNLIVLSDHGMAWVPRENNVRIAPLLKPHWVRKLSGYLPCMVYANEGCADSVYNALRGIDHCRVWRKQEVPAYLHFGQNPRIGDVIVSPDCGYAVYDGDWQDGATHGFDPTLPEMQAVFRAVGPAFRHVKLRHFRNVDVYPLLCHLLGIQPSQNDGSLEEVSDMLAK